MYIPLILLYKSEGGTLNIKQYQNETDDKIFQKNSTGNSGNSSVDNNNDPQNEEPEIIYNSDDNNTAETVANPMELPRLSQLAELPVVKDKPSNPNQSSIVMVAQNKNNSNLPNNESNLTGIYVQKCLFQFLYRNQSNHCIFSDYLRFCFAIENLQFVERVSIFYQIVVRLQQKNRFSILNSKSPAMMIALHSNHSHTLSIDTQHALPLPIPVPHSSRNLYNSMDLSQIDMSRMSAVYVEGNGIGINGLLFSQSYTTATSPNSRETSPPTSPAITPVTPIPNPVNWNDLKKGSSQNANDDCAELRYIYRFEFAYLKDVNNHYGQIIETVYHSQKDNNEFDAGMEQQHDVTIYRQALFTICKEIYDQFIDDKAISQVLYFLMFNLYTPDFKKCLVSSDLLKTSNLTCLMHTHLHKYFWYTLINFVYMLTTFR